MSDEKRLSIYLSGLLRHRPEKIGLEMDSQGWVSVKQLITNVNAAGKYHLTMELLERIVETDDKQRYRFNADRSRIAACQGHSVPGVRPELQYLQPPEILYHGTTRASWKTIKRCGFISRMNRHAVHLHATEAEAWRSAGRRRQEAVVLKVQARKLWQDGVDIGMAFNGVWCAERVDLQYIWETLSDPE